MLAIEGLTGGYGQSQVLFGVTLDVQAKEIVAVLGRNGMGKTTLLQTILGYVRATGGRVTIGGVDVTGWRAENIARLGVGYVPQERNVFTSLSVRENLQLAVSGARHERAARLAEVVELFPRLGERMRQSAGTLSGGERKMLAIGRALVAGPRLLVLDEPTEGVWPAIVQEIEQRLAGLADQMSILIVEQHLRMALSLARRVYVMERGTMVLSGSSEEVGRNPLLARYLAP